ncbi:MAG: TIGR02646 family protein [Deltaproteobacteria bacterium]|nr:TIGR02646 family protein [Deltaproteobacteria bacterium]
MIKINRNRKDENGNPIRPNDEWFEKARDETDIAIREQGNHKAKATIYGHPQVRMALEKLFYDKCAYCETKVTARSDWDVEHFRPKGRVAENDNHDGYYWLAYNWENFYLSCTHCNQRRKDKPRWGDLRQAGAGGKMGQFPLEDETTRAMSPQDDTNQEQVLLLDPCSDDPEEHLCFDLKGQIIRVNNSRKSAVSIEVFSLWQRRLCDFRREKVEEVVGLLSLKNKCENEDKMEVVQHLNNHLERFLLADNCQYAAVARAVVNDPDVFGL